MALLTAKNNTANQLNVGSLSFAPGESKSLDFLTGELADAARKSLVVITAPNGGAMVGFKLTNLVATTIASYATGYVALVDTGYVAANRNDAILAAKVAGLENTLAALLNSMGPTRTGVNPQVALKA